jgi:Glycosyl hydrolase family 14
VVTRSDPRGRTQALRYLLLTAAAVLVTAGLCAAPASAASLDGFYGVNVQQVFSGSSSAWQPQLAAMSSGGLQLARIDARWSNVEPNPPSGGTHNYNWSQYDSMVQAMAQQGLRWYPIVAYSTPWAGVIAGDSNSVVAPNHVGDFAAFAAAFARRYGRGGSFWSSHSWLPQLPVVNYEIWNEENSTAFLHPQTSAPEAYADLYMAARGAIKSVDPQADVVVGGLALGKADVTDEIQFLQRMYAHRPDLVGNVDGVGLHPYQQTLADTYMRLAKFRQALDQIAGPSVPIEITEVGWATTSVSESERATDLSLLAEQLPNSDCNVDRLLPYTWLTQESDPSDPESWFGIWNHDGSGKPSGVAYLNAVKLMRGLTSTTPPSGQNAICHPAAAAQGAGAATGPRLRMRVVGVRPRHWVKVSVRCEPACLLRLDLYGRGKRPKAGQRRLSTRTGGLRSHRRVFKLRIRRAGALRRRALVSATAVGRTGGVTKRHRHVRIR